MEKINWKLAERFGSHWVKVKFYKTKPDLKQAHTIKGVSFCEAVKKSIIGPILLDKGSLSCKGAQHALGWSADNDIGFLHSCREKSQAPPKRLKSIFYKVPHFKKPFECIGLNTSGRPDLLISFMDPERVKELVRLYNYHTGKDLDISLSGMMAICGGIAARSYLKGDISISFGCDESRRLTDMGRDRLAVGIPYKQLKLFIE
jgi:uncharacterized protein (DUF169 family)